MVRTLGTATHETAHILTMQHCKVHACSMNGSNSLSETDRAPVHECPLCQRKLQWNIGYDAAKRFEALRAFYEKYKLKPEAEWMAARLKHWQALQKIENYAKRVPLQASPSTAHLFIIAPLIGASFAFLTAVGLIIYFALR